MFCMLCVKVWAWSDEVGVRGPEGSGGGGGRGRFVKLSEFSDNGQLFGRDNLSRDRKEKLDHEANAFGNL